MEPEAKDLLPGPVDWVVAEAVARRLLRRSEPLSPRVRARLDDELAEATSRAEVLVAEVTGLTSAAGPARAVVTDRSGWVQANVAALQRLLRPLGERLAAGTRREQRSLSRASRVASGVEVGLVLAWMSGRVLGQYDIAVDGDPGAGASRGGDVVYYVGPNVVELERRHGFAPDEFRLWIALHEVTHRMQFTGVPWMRSHFLGLVERGTGLATPDASVVLDGLLRAASEIRAGRNPLDEGGVVGLVASAEQLGVMHEAQALMSLLEGHGDVVMSLAGSGRIPGADRFAATLRARRESVTGVARALQKAVGLEAKMRQYAQGEHFVDEVLAAGGGELFALVWSSPEMLPNLEEIRAPDRWIARALEVAAASA